MTQTINKTRKQTEITSPVIYRCTCKETGEVFYGVKSDSSDETYKVTYNEQAHRYECSCPATCECKHLRAVREVVKAKAESQKQQAPTHEGEGKLPQETRQALANWHQSQAGDAMEREYTAPKYNFNSLGYPTSGYRKLDSNA